MKFETRNLISAFKRRFAARARIDTSADGIGVRVPIPQAVEMAM